MVRLVVQRDYCPRSFCGKLILLSSMYLNFASIRAEFSSKRKRDCLLEIIGMRGNFRREINPLSELFREEQGLKRRLVKGKTRELSKGKQG